MTNKIKDNIDEKVLDLFNKVKQKQKDISILSKKPNWRTSCTLQFVEGNISTSHNLQTVTGINKIIELYAFILQKEQLYTQACDELGIKNTAPLYIGYSFSDWKADIKTRLDILTLNAKKDELKTLEQRLDKLISPEQRREIELSELEQLVTDNT